MGIVRKQGHYTCHRRALANDTRITKARTIHPKVIDRDWTKEAMIKKKTQRSERRKARTSRPFACADVLSNGWMDCLRLVGWMVDCMGVLITR